METQESATAGAAVNQSVSRSANELATPQLNGSVSRGGYKSTRKSRRNKKCKSRRNKKCKSTRK